MLERLHERMARRILDVANELRVINSASEGRADGPHR
jgi:hypothetical protein